MAKFTKLERRISKRIADDDRLLTSLAQIREAMENIWGVEQRIVRDYTEHGNRHSERLADWAGKLLARQKGQKLTATEAYLLLAGIYLHDIGMQCDVVNLPEVKSLAEELGARFEVQFTAGTASAYGLDEQRAIRKNHQYLTAAWIDYASRSGETSLGPAICSVPEDLVGDLMDVCKYHSRLPITECPANLKYREGRKQLVAASCGSRMNWISTPLVCPTSL